MKNNYDFSKGAKIKGKLHSKSQVVKAIRENEKILTSIRLDKDIVDVAKKKAQEEGVGYLTWLNLQLRKIVLQEETLDDRVKKLEKAVFKKK